MTYIARASRELDGDAKLLARKLAHAAALLLLFAPVVKRKVKAAPGLNKPIRLETTPMPPPVSQ